MRLLRETLAAARRGTGAAVLLSGEAGVGKTRLARELAAGAAAEGFAVAWGACWADGGAPPLWPWQAVLAELGDGASVLAGDPGGREVDPERFARFTAVTGEVARAARAAPVLIVIDDAHAADAGAVLLARFLARGIARLPVVLLVTARSAADPRDGGEGAPETGDRPGPTGPAPPPLAPLDSEAILLTLRPLDLEETAAMLAAYGFHEVDADLLRTVWRLTRGNPLFVHRVLALGPDGARTGRIAPEDVRAAIATALDRLTPRTRDILGAAAVIGVSPAVSEVAAVTGAAAEIGAALDEARRHGLVAEGDPGAVAFTHELIRESLRDRLGAGERREVHAAAARVLGGGGPAASPRRLARYAHHAVAAAGRSARDARTAVAACRAAAAAMSRGLAPEQAVELLDTALRVHRESIPGEPVAELLVERAQAVLGCGRLARARRLFDRAAAAAEAEGDTLALGRAACGLGGVWVNEHRIRADWERVVGLQRAALAGLPEREAGLRARLAVRVAAEEVYQGGPIEPVLDALALARDSGEGAVLAEALSLTHHALLTPRHTRVRLALAEELIAVASRAGEGVLTLIGLCWRAVDLFHLGDPRARRALAELSERVEALACRSVSYVAEVMETMLLIRAGELAAAEARALACYELGTEVGDADALGYLGAQLTTIRWLQGRDAEMLATVEEIAASPTLVPAEFAFQATLACLAARAGQPGRARQVLDQITARGLAALPESSTWAAGMLAILECAHLLGDAGLAREGYRLLAPYADLPVMPSLAVTCLGSAHRPLGLAALTFGRPDLAVDHLDRAVAADRAVGNRPVAAIARAHLAEALRVRGRAGDRERADRLLAEAGREAEALGMAARAREWAARRAGTRADQGVIARAGRHWRLSAGGRHVIVPHRIGMSYLAVLLTSPDRDVPALELAALGAGEPALAAPARQSVLDERARAEYRRRVRELAAELAELPPRDAPGRGDRLRAELAALTRELDRQTAMAGRPRAFADPGERARTAVRKAIKRAVDEIAGADAELGGLLRDTVSTGTTCRYSPDPARPLRWKLDAAPDDPADPAARPGTAPAGGDDGW